MKRATEMRQKTNSSIVIKAKTPTTPGAGVACLSTEVDIDPCELAREALDHEAEDPNLELEGSPLGRGVSYYDPVERRQYEIETLDLKVWHVCVGGGSAEGEGLNELKGDAAAGQFWSEDTYVVRWKYKVSLTGRDLKGRPSKHVAVGRER